MIIQHTNLGHLRLEIQQESRCITLIISGSINETFEPESMLQIVNRHLASTPPTPQKPGSKKHESPAQGANLLLINLENLKQMNSRGAREWTNFIKSLSPQTLIRFERASIIFMDQFNILPSILGHGRIESFYAPYYCEKCAIEVNLLLRVDQHVPDIRQSKAPAKIHDCCHSSLVFDASEKVFFGLLKKFI